MRTKNIILIFTILKETILLIKLILDEWEKNDNDEKE